jgi:hypothetical protein
MFFFFKPSTINIDCFCVDEIVFSNFKPERANKFIPEYYKNLPTYLEGKAIPNTKTRLITKMPTLKKCNGFIDLFSHGFILPSWADFQIEMLNDGNFFYSNLTDIQSNTSMVRHPRSQFGEELYKDSGHIKIESPWFLKEKTGVKFTWMNCAWHNTQNLQDFYFLSGVVDFKLQWGTNINAFQRNGTIVQFHGGDPLAHIIPISDKKVKLTHHLLSKEEHEKMVQREMIAPRFTNSRELKSKCPV